VLYAVGSAARVATGLLTGHWGYLGEPGDVLAHPVPYQQPLTMVSTAPVFAIAAAAYRRFQGGTPGGAVTLWSLVGLEAAAGALAGGKQAFVVSLLAVLVPYGALRGRLPGRVLLAGAVVYLCVVVPFTTGYRQVVRGDGEVLAPGAAVVAAPAVLRGALRGGSLVDSADLTLRRVRDIDGLAIVVQLTPDVIPYRDPVEYAWAPAVGVVARALWPGKPVLAGGYRFSQEYYGLPDTVYTSAAVTPLGDLYRHGGWPPVLAGMALLGAGCRLCDDLLRPERDPRAVFLLLALFPVVVKAEADVFTLVAGLPATILTGVLGARLACRPGAVAR
jgi:hypothetical protein